MKSEPEVAFLLSQLGAHSAAEFRKRVQGMDLTTGHSGIIRLIGLSDKLSQKELAAKLSMLPSRLVVLIDELEEKGLVERHSDPDDRRSHILRLSPEGRETMKALGGLSRKLSDQICASLSNAERTTLAGLLKKIATEQGLTPNLHPGYRDRE